ncbi:MAG: hypothetical protein HN403_11100 [Rhodospirillales bacterium]|nr:hypothetical protein [Rhodospirillales bacterium]
MLKRTLLLVTALGMLGACAQTQYGQYGKDDESGFLDRKVGFEVARTFYEDPPQGAVVAPFEGAEKIGGRARVIEESLARQLSARVDRVIGPGPRDRMVRSFAVDLSNPRDRKSFASSARCGYLVESRPWGGDSVFALFWTQERIGLDISMVRIIDGAVVWKARHIATRSEGGLPLSPFSAVYNLATVGQFKMDGDVAISLVDDATRRIVATLPDARTYGIAENGRPNKRQ